MRTGTLTLRITSALDHVFLVGLSVRGICAGVSLDTARSSRSSWFQSPTASPENPMTRSPLLGRHANPPA